jgi:hypothetical protein
MTDGPGYYGPPADDLRAPVRPLPAGQLAGGRDPVEPWRVLLVVLGCLVGPPAGAVAGFFGAVTYSGCFFSCEQAQPVLGASLVLLGLLLLPSGPLLAALLIRRAAAVGLAVLGIPVGLVVGFAALRLGVV